MKILQYCCQKKDLILFLTVVVFVFCFKITYFLNTKFSFASDGHQYLQVARYFAGMSTSVVSLEKLDKCFPLGYPFFISIFLRLFGESEQCLFLINIVASTIGTIFLFLMVKDLHNSLSALIITLIYTCNYEVFQWDKFFLADCFFINVTIGCLYVVKQIFFNRNFSEKTFRIKTIWLFFLFSLFCFLSYIKLAFVPYVAAVAVAIFLQWSFKKIYVWLRVSILLCFILATAFMGNKFIPSWIESYTPRLTSGEVIFDRHEYDVRREVKYTELNIKQKIEFIVELYIKRGVYFWSILYNSYSFKHKVLNLIYLLPFYLLFLVGIILFGCNYKKMILEYTTFNIALLLIIIAFWLFYVFTEIDYDSRYRATIFPFMTLFLVNTFKFLPYRNKLEMTLA